MAMNQSPFIIKYPETRNEILPLRSISPPRHETIFFSPASHSRVELKVPSSLSYTGITYPYQPHEIVTKCHNCSYKYCNELPRRWSIISNNHIEKINPRQLDEEQFTRQQGMCHETINTKGV